MAQWIWRCHIDASHPDRTIWKYLEKAISHYSAAIFSMPAFARPLACPMFLIPPSIDPLSDKNCAMPERERLETLSRLGIDPERPLLVQVSRFDRFKDPLGVIEAYRLLKPYHPEMQLALAGGPADDDPEGAEVLREVLDLAGDDPDLKVLMLPPDAHRTINALQRSATVVLQKSLREGFGLTVTEALWKGKPVIGGACGGITLQVHDYHTGFLVHSPAGAAYRIHYLLRYADKRQRMGQTGHDFIREHFLLDSQSPRLSDDAALPGSSRIADHRGVKRNAAAHPSFRRSPTDELNAILIEPAPCTVHLAEAHRAVGYPEPFCNPAAISKVSPQALGSLLLLGDYHADFGVLGGVRLDADDLRQVGNREYVVPTIRLGGFLLGCGIKIKAVADSRSFHVGYEAHVTCNESAEPVLHQFPQATCVDEPL